MVLVRPLHACRGHQIHQRLPRLALQLTSSQHKYRAGGGVGLVPIAVGQLSLAGVDPAQDRIPYQAASAASTTTCAASYP
jgi:hypothetical protein